MADVKFEVTRFAMSTGSGTQDVTISGFGTPKGAIFIFSCATVNDTVTTHSRYGIGMTDGTREFCWYQVDRDALSTIDSHRRSWTSCIKSFTIGGTSIDLDFSFNSWITDGVRLNIDNTSPSAFLVTTVLIGGADVSNVYVNAYNDLGTSTRTVNITAPGFEPDIVFLPMPFMTDYNGSVNFFDTRLSLGVGVNDGTDKQAAIASHSDDGVGTSDVRTGVSNTYGIVRVDNGNSSFGLTGNITDYDASGFSVGVTNSAVSAILFYMCIKFNAGVKFDVIDLDIPTSGTYTISSLGFRPEFGFMCTAIAPTTRETVESANDLSFGIFAHDETNQYMVNTKAQGDASTSVCKTLAADSFKMLDYNTANTEIEVSNLAIKGDGYEWSFTTHPGLTTLGWALAISGYWNNTVAAEKSPGKVTGVSGKVLANVMGVA
jgi:hypothetical protein